nr:hypothetical protein Iba_chr03cCG1430 [Ipomoea batatas]
MKVIGFQLTFPSNINTKCHAEQFLESFLQGSINIDFGRGGNHHPWELLVEDLELYIEI